MPERLTPVKAIRAKCLDCCCGQRGEVRLCPVHDCSLHPYRMGRRPIGGNGEDARFAEESDRLAGTLGGDNPPMTQPLQGG